MINCIIFTEDTVFLVLQVI